MRHKGGWLIKLFNNWKGREIERRRQLGREFGALIPDSSLTFTEILGASGVYPCFTGTNPESGGE